MADPCLLLSLLTAPCLPSIPPRLHGDVETDEAEGASSMVEWSRSSNTEVKREKQWPMFQFHSRKTVSPYPITQQNTYVSPLQLHHSEFLALEKSEETLVSLSTLHHLCKSLARFLLSQTVAATMDNNNLFSDYFSDDLDSFPYPPLQP
ncbi:hypothetical protein JHK82_012414 [Glycine max]|nr:hypothetical protein JHK85_012765 [Glycine max]KAG5154445.1 hypothetical protein JHK82_012414 [Glycine max]